MKPFSDEAFDGASQKKNGDVRAEAAIQNNPLIY
jgi:hypothetical protein